MAKLTSFDTDIRPLFTERDIRAMSKAFKIGNYEDVKAHAAVIYDRIRGSVVQSCRALRRKEKVRGPNPEVNCSRNG